MINRNTLGAAFMAVLAATPSFADDEIDMIDLCGDYYMCTYYQTEQGTTIRIKATNGEPDHPSRMLIEIFEKRGLIGNDVNIQEAEEAPETVPASDYEQRSLG